MCYQPRPLDELDQALWPAVEGGPPGLHRTLRPVLEQNLASGRAARYIERNGLPGLEAYVQRVVQIALAEVDRLLEIYDRGELVWDVMTRQLQRDARIQLHRQGLPPGEIEARAADLAQEVCLILLRVHYPADVPYMQWVRRVLRNHINHCSFRSRELLDSRQVERVDLTEWELMDQAAVTDEPLAGREADELAWALERLPSAAQRQIMRRSLEGWPLENIAAEIGRSPQAVYNLRHRAIREIQRLLKEADAELEEKLRQPPTFRGLWKET